MDATKLIAWLPFDESTTADKCGNSWTAYGTTSIGTTNAISGQALQLNKGYLRSSGQITFGGADFTVDFYGYMNSSSESWAGLFCAQSTTNTAGGSRRGQIAFHRNNTANTLVFDCYNANGSKLCDVTLSNTNWLNGRHHFELDYSHATSTVKIFIDGRLSLTQTITLERLSRYIFLGVNSYDPPVQRMVGTIDEFRLFDGVALHTTDFTPPTSADYAELSLSLGYPATLTRTFDVERKLSNVVEFTADVERTVIAAWRYFNAGTTDTLTVTGTTLTDLPETKAVTGTAFYQTTRAKCFDLPATDEVWLKFDVYFDGTNRWRAYNGGANGTTGITAQTTGDLSFFSNENNVQQPTGICKKNQLQTVLLHMISGSSAGVVEAWVDGTKIHTYTGDVNHGEDFADIYLQSDGAGTFFSNVIISNRQLTQADGYQSFTADVERRTTKRIEFTVDVERSFILPLIIPLIMGGHFNHYVAEMPVLNDMTYKIVLPKESKAYLHADGINGGAVKIYSDTDDTGTVTSDVYAELGDCKKVYIKSVVSQQSVIKAFMHSLSETNLAGTAAVDEAVNYCSGGLFKTAEEVTNQLTREMTAAEAAGTFDEFLRDRCGIILDNEDTGSATGADAGSGTIKTAESIVPERIPVSEWVTPENLSTTTIKGLTVSFPLVDESIEYYDAKRFILTGLNSCWIEEALTLIEETFGLSFEDAGTTVKYLSVDFENWWADGTIAFVESYPDDDGNTYYLCMTFCIPICQYIDPTSADGKIDYGVTPHLDRVVAHELTHAVMAANIKYYSDLPEFIREGAAELVHGVDDTRNFSNADEYTAGYLFFRYLMKQTMEHLPPTAQVTLTNLFISEGALDSDGHALTDNTRAIFNADVISELIKHVTFDADVEILDVLYINFVADVMRSIIGKVKLFAVDSSAYFEENPAGSELTPVVIPSQSLTDIGRSPAAPNNTNGLQSVEISIAEQQITENVHFVGNVPFDIMYPVRGQYLDYLIDMRVERVQKNGILYSCDCCSDIDEILFTQLAYTVPKTMTWNDVRNGETIEKKTHYPPATFHVQRIAAALGLQAVMQFEDFLSTVTSDDIGGATYADLIRELFGWSSRVPTQMINYFIRNGVLYIVQRGYEARLIDLSFTKHTIPIILHELVRMTWGSTRWSKTETIEDIRFRPPPKASESSSDDTGSGTGDDSGGDDTISGGGDDTISGGGDDNPDDPDDDNDDNEDAAWMNMKEVVVEDSEGITRTTYDYDGDGVLQKTVAEFTSKTNAEENSITTTTQFYNSDGLLKETVSEVEHPNAKSPTEDTKTVTTYGYDEWEDGRIYLAVEMIEMYSKDKSGSYKLDDTRTTTKSPTGRGQTTTNDDNGNADSGGGTGDDRPTPYQESRTNLAKEAALKKKLSDTSDMDEDKFAKQTAFNADHELNYYTEKLSRTVNGLSLYDSSFPIHNTNKLIALTEAIKWLNRRTKETVTMTIYEYPHLLDFNDRIIFEGNVYFLVSNTATTTERIFNEQRITMVRWY